MKLYRVMYRPCHNEARYAWVVARNERQARDVIDRQYRFKGALPSPDLHRGVEDILDIVEAPMDNAGIIAYN